MSNTTKKTSSSQFIPEKINSRILVITFLSSLILGTIGYKHYAHGGETVYITNALYHAVQLFVLHAPHFGAPVPWTLEIARWLAAASTGFVLYNTALHLLHNERMAYVLKRREKHVVVCGLGRRGMVVVEKLHASGIKLVAIDKNPEPDVVERLNALHIPLITGDAARKEILKQARIEYADRFFTFCPDDTINIEIALEAQKIGNKTGSSRQCFIHINDAELRNALQSNTNKKVSAKPTQVLHFIDAYEPEAISVLTEKLPLDHDGISPNDSKQVHLIILGFGCMGRIIAVKAAQLGVFANRKNLRISVIDHKAELNRSSLLFHHPYIEEVADIKFYHQEVLSLETRNQIEKWCSEPNTLVNVAVCFDNTTLAYDTVFNLLPLFNRKNVRVAVRINEPESFDFLLKGAKAEKDNNLTITTFGLERSFENLTSPLDNVIEKFAIDIHKAYVKMIHKENENTPEELEKKLESGELNDWKNLSEDFRESNRQQAVHIGFKLRASGYEMVDIHDPRPAIEIFPPKLLDNLAIMEHNRWVAERKVNNWKYGAKTDKSNRINANITDWDKLTDEIKEYDYVTVRRIPELLKLIGMKMVEKQLKVLTY
ncbi:MAG: NAD-binding protein [Bacteroidales bacterium]